MSKSIVGVLAVTVFLLAGCENKENLIEPTYFAFDFISDTEGWSAEFADYPDEPDVDTLYELEFSHSILPSPLDTLEGALRQSGNNHSDDLFMFIKKKLTGLEPNTLYHFDIEIAFATNAASDYAGVGGSPGESVYIKAGVSTVEPVKVLNHADNYFRMNIDKDNQVQESATVKTIGDFSNGTDLFDYTLKVLKTTRPPQVMTNSNGEVWVIVGTDSGYESTTTIYYDRVTIHAY
jgi:uncharacterized lipoprotein NlpE involved in copper resistance